MGQLAALDQQVRQLESFGVVINDDTYAELRRWVPYRPAISAALILIGWPVSWVALASILKGIGNRVTRRQIAFAQVLTVVVHASSVFAVRSMIAAPLNYARESIGGATSLNILMPAFGESTFPARMLGAVDIFVVWWAVLVAMGFGILYETHRYRSHVGCSARTLQAPSFLRSLRLCEEASSCRETRKSSSAQWPCS